MGVFHIFENCANGSKSRKISYLSHISSLVACLAPNMLKTSNSISCDCQYVAEGETWSYTENSKNVLIHQFNQQAHYIQVF